jgi:Uma2 family endonuclease
MKDIELRRWSRDEYDQMVATGIFYPGERVELIDGEILAVTPQGSAHATGIQLAADALRASFGSGVVVRAQLPMAAGTHSEPEPDIAVVRGTPRDYREAHPTSALLIVEIADATLDYDRQRKGRLYARAGIQDYWIVNLNDRCVEMYRDHSQASYRFSCRFMPGETISPLAAPGAQIAVSDILP